jgi:hypothetical protein
MIIILIIISISRFLNVSSSKSLIISDSKALNLRSNSSLYVRRLRRLLAAKLTAFKRRLVAIGFNAVFFIVRAVFSMIFRSLAAEGVPFYS